ncbi:MAG: hypothetical protein EXR54_09435 [Dehalococcoidia bacterium]|nr:hypothetical protein [Dehalococcoidia bacterium]
MDSLLDRVRRLTQKSPETGKYEINELDEKRVGPQESIDTLLGRLRAGHRHLIECSKRLIAQATLYDGMADELTRGLDTFEALEKLLREVYGYQGCVMGQGRHCPTASPVWCRACGPTGSRQ